MFQLHPSPDMWMRMRNLEKSLELICSCEKRFQCSPLNLDVAPSERSSTVPSIWMNSSLLDFFLHQGCPCLSFSSITAAFAEIAIKISTARFAPFSGVRNLNERTLLQRAGPVSTDHLAWLTAFSRLFKVIFGLSPFFSFLDGSFACPTYYIPQSELEAFFSLIQISLSVCSLFILPFSLFPSGFSAICSCLWHLLFLPFHSFHIDSAFYPWSLSSSFPFAFPLFVLPHWQIFLRHLRIFWLSWKTIILSVYLGCNSSPLYT